MAHKRLTQEAREYVTTQLVAAATHKAITANQIKEGEMARKILDHNLGKHKKTFEILPDSLVNTNISIQLIVRDLPGTGTSHNRISFFEAADGEAKKARLKIPQSGYLHLDGTSTAEAKMAHKATQILDERKELAAKRTRLEREVKALLSTHKSSKTLEEDWPEAYKIWVKIYGEEPKANLPAVPSPKLKSMLEEFPDAVDA